jgi:hypothetical protein
MPDRAIVIRFHSDPVREQGDSGREVTVPVFGMHAAVTLDRRD